MATFELKWPPKCTCKSHVDEKALEENGEIQIAFKSNKELNKNVDKDMQI